MRKIVFLFLVLAFIVPFSVLAHEVRPGYIEINERARDEFSIIWKQPVRDGVTQVAGLGLRPIFPTNCTRLEDSVFHRRPGVLLERFALACKGGLLGQTIGVEGLQKTITDIFVRLTMLDGETSTLRLTAEEPQARFAGGGAGLSSYFLLGVEHLLFGFDHILFVLGLIFLSGNVRALVLMITGFTLAHSLTLALSALSILYLSPRAVEAAIALSIVFVASEIARPRARRSLFANRFSQSVAFLFGLVHGAGFAGVLADIGLPREATLWALALFNIGLEAGQILLLGAVLGALALLRPSPDMRAHITTSVCLLCGTMGVYWFLTRAFAIFV